MVLGRHGILWCIPEVVSQFPGMVGPGDLEVYDVDVVKLSLASSWLGHISKLALPCVWPGGRGRTECRPRDRVFDGLGCWPASPATTPGTIAEDGHEI